MSVPFLPNADEIFTAMENAVKANPSLRSKFNAIVEFHLKDDVIQNENTDDELKKCRLVISNKEKKDDTDTDKKSPDLTVITKLSILHQLLTKKLTSQQAFMQGKLKIKGKMSLAMKLTMVLNATRKLLLQNMDKPSSSSSSLSSSARSKL